MIRITLAAVALAVVASGAQAQTRPAVRSLGPNFPVGNPYHATIDEPTARLLQKVAWETVQDYYGK